jgi:hypothetical protein
MSYSNYEQTVIINGHRLLGVQSVDGSYGITEKPIRVAGVGFIDAMSDAPLQGNFSVNRKMVGADPLLEKNSLGKYLFDEQEIDGVILYDNDTKGFGFTKGRVSRYSVNCSVGNIPDIQTDITVYGSLGRNVLKNNSYSQNLNSSYYPTSLSQVYIGERGSSSNVVDSWNAGTLSTTDEKYSNIPDITRERRWTSTVSGITYRWLELGKDSFTLVPYGAVIKHADQSIKYPDQSSIKFNVSDFSIDAVVDFSFSRSINVVPLYALQKDGVATWNSGQTITSPNYDPVQIDTQYPIETDISVTMIANTYEIREIKDRLQNTPRAEISIDICDANDHTNIINSFVGKNVRLISESINSTTEEEMNISLSYKSYESYHNEV